jgi:probable blue pigment (indigoidine) exporter
MSERLTSTLFAALAPIAWGTTYLVATELLPDGRPMLAAALRALPAGLLLLVAFRRLPEGVWWWRASVLGTLNIGLFFALLFVAAYRLPGGVAATVGAFQPLAVSLLAWPLLGERLSRTKAVAGSVGVLGVGLLVLQGSVALDPLGLAAALAGTLSMAAGVVLTKRWGRPAPLLVFTSWQLVAGGLLLAPLAYLLEGPPPVMSPTNGAGLLYLGIVGTAGAYALWFRGIGRLPASSVSFLGLLSPVVASTLGFLVLGETLEPAQLLGAGLVFAGVLLGQSAGETGAPKGAVAGAPGSIASADVSVKGAGAEAAAVRERHPRRCGDGRGVAVVMAVVRHRLPDRRPSRTASPSSSTAARTVEELVRSLGLTNNDVRAYLATLERDGVVRQRGSVRPGSGGGKPAYVYELTPEAEDLFPKAYEPVFGYLLDTVPEGLGPKKSEALLRDVGCRMADGRGAPDGGVRARLEEAVAVLNELGGLAGLEEDSKRKTKASSSGATVARWPP